MTEIFIKSEKNYKITRGSETNKDLNVLLLALSQGLDAERKLGAGVGDARIIVHNGHSELNTGSLSKKAIHNAIKKIRKSLTIENVTT